LARWADSGATSARCPCHLGSDLIAGKVDSLDAGAHRITVRVLILRFWGGYALRNGDLGTGERSAFVYRTIPLLGLKYVLVFWKGGDAPLQSVGGVIHAFFLALGLGGAILVPALKQGYPVWFIPVCVALCVESCVYLLLLLFAKRALHGFIDRSVVNWRGAGAGFLMLSDRRIVVWDILSPRSAIKATRSRYLSR
jgi:hypothetical protein